MMQIQEAANHNKSLRLSRDEWAGLQIRLPTDPDGLPGELTAEAIARWQADNCLEVSGALDEPTFELLSSLKTPWHRLKRYGLYWDRGARWTVENATSLARDLQRLGYDHVQTMIDSHSAKGWAPRWTPEQLSIWAKALAAVGITHGITAWAYPDRERIRGLDEQVVEFVDAAKAIAFGLNAEEGMKDHRVRGYSDAMEAVEDLIGTMMQAQAVGARSQVVTYAHMLGNRDREVNVLCKRASVAILEFYSTGTRSGRKWHDRHGPGREQYLGAARYRARCLPYEDEKGETRQPAALAAAHSAYDQSSWKGRTPVEARLRALEASLWLGCEEHYDWSAGWVLGRKPNSGANRRYNAEYMAEVRKRRAAAPWGLFA